MKRVTQLDWNGSYNSWLNGKGLFGLLDLSGCTELVRLSCYNNQLTALNVSKNTELEELRCWNSTLQNVLISPSAIAKTKIYLFDGSETSWTFRNRLGTTLGATAASGNSYYTVSELPLYATNAARMQTIAFLVNTIPSGYAESDYNSMLLFLEYADANGVKNGVKINSYYSLDDPTTWTGVTWTQINGVNRITRIEWNSIGLSGSLNLTGCPVLDYLSCYNNQLTTLDVSNNTALTYLNCFDNQLTTLDVSNSTALTQLSCFNNQLTTLDVSNNTALTVLYCWNSTLQKVLISSSAVWKTDINLNYGSETSWTFKNRGGTTLPIFATNAAGMQTIVFLVNTVPTGYAESDYNSMLLFLEYADAYGVKNGVKINPYYSFDNPTTTAATQSLASIILSTSASEVDTTITTTLVPEDATATYQWYRIDVSNNETQIPEATSSSYTVTAADLGYYFKVVATGTGNYTGTVEATTTTAATQDLASISLSTSAPEVDTTIITTLAPEDATATYQWYRGTDSASITEQITDATLSSYTVTSADLGYYFKVIATGTGNYTGSVEAVTTTAATENLASITLSTSAPVVGTEITTTLAPEGATATYQWYRGTSLTDYSTPILDATECAYTVTNEDEGYYLNLVANGVNNYVGEVTGGVYVKVWPKVSLSQEVYTVQEGSSLYISVGHSEGESLTYWWDLSGTGNGEYIEGNSAFWVSTSDLQLMPGEYTIRVKVIDQAGIESDPAIAQLDIVEVPPCITIEQKELLDGQILVLDIFADYYGRTAQKWTINWGDRSESVFDCLSNSLSAAHFYSSQAEAKAYNISLNLVDSNGHGGDISYYLVTYTVPAQQIEPAQLIVPTQLFTENSISNECTLCNIEPEITVDEICNPMDRSQKQNRKPKVSADLSDNQAFSPQNALSQALAEFVFEEEESVPWDEWINLRHSDTDSKNETLNKDLLFESWDDKLAFHWK